MIMILFVMPIKLDFWCFRSSAAKDERPIANQAMLTWEFIHEKLPWGLVLLLGIINHFYFHKIQIYNYNSIL